MSSSLVTPPAGSPPTPPTRGFSALAAIIAELASSQPLEESVARSLDSLRLVLGVPECAIWLHSKNELVRAWGAGDPLVTAAQVRSRLEHPGPQSDSLLVVSIATGNGEAGGLAVRLSHELIEEETLLVTAVANLLAPELAHAEKNRQLEVEVEARTA